MDKVSEMINPHDKYKQFMKNVHKANIKKYGPEPDPEIDNMLDEVVDELEEIGEEMEKKELDKNLGNTKFSMTKEEFVEIKQKQFDHETASKINSLANLKASKLNPEEQVLMKKTLESFQAEKITDKLLLHLVIKKIRLTEESQKFQTEAKSLQMKLLNELTTLTDKVVKSQGALEVFNQDILEYVKKDPALIE